MNLCVYIVRKTEKRINRILWVCVLYIVSCLYLEITFLISSKNIALPVASRNEFSVFKGNRHVSDFRFVFVILARKKKILSTKINITMKTNSVRVIVNRV